MRFSILLSLLLSTCCATPADNIVHVGFDLKPTYGTSAVAYENGTLAAIVHVTGNGDYKEAMRKLSMESSTHRACVTLTKRVGPD